MSAENGQIVERPDLAKSLSARENDFVNFFRDATGFRPYRWQICAAVEGLPEILPVPTGLGKTEGSVLAWARRRVAHILEEATVRVQDSVFEARMNPQAAEQLARAAARELDESDSLRVYAIGAGTLGRCLAFGAPPLPERHDFYLL